ncbi:response regulator [Paenibacillus prosopidis]|uniref:Two-component system response regulator YesN n=1 Tax=Paenibacillus prosopidis TaxID=630520 RepID=A0A368VP56_9BACL|nr:response regulator [Paenibacillus prosopidis]RCW43511.1 two-component system response regulator YesN [Paenibacillus prosopidis]
MTYQMIIVDDEIHAVEGVKSDLDLNKLGITGLFTAYNIRQAKDIFENEVIDIMLCDIEMPQGSGMELLTWVREHHPNTATIFLTSHADFKYAKEALELGCLDYLLKPVLAIDLEKAIRKAQSVIDRNMEISRNSKSHQLWLKHHSLIIERFWLDLINHSMPSDPVAIREQIECHHIPITEDSIFLPILIGVQRWNKTLKHRDEKILEYALKNTAEEVIIGNKENGICFHLDQGKLLVIVTADSGADWGYNQVQDACRQYIDACNRYFYSDLSCYLGQTVEAYEMASMVADLKARDRNNVAFVNKVHPYRDLQQIDQPIMLPYFSLLSSLLKTGSKEYVIKEIEAYLDELARNQGLDAKILHQFNQVFMQVVYSYLYSTEIQADKLFGDEDSRQLLQTADRSVTDMLTLVRHVVNKAMDHAEAIKESITVVQTVKRYIALNIDQDLSRELIAEQVFLNPDHLTRLLKKETGYSISDYVIMERIKLAKELLTQTNIPISLIATSVGYTHFSHFTKIFKKYAEMGPTEYRAQFRTIT